MKITSREIVEILKTARELGYREFRLEHEGLQLAIEGHTDSVGTDLYNQGLSERRAESVRAYLVDQKFSSASVGATGLGEGQPVASNDTATGRQQNRRVELIVSGDIIGRR